MYYRGHAIWVTALDPLRSAARPLYKFNILGAAISGGAQNITMFISGLMICRHRPGASPRRLLVAYVSETTAPP